MARKKLDGFKSSSLEAFESTLEKLNVLCRTECFSAMEN